MENNVILEYMTTYSEEEQVRMRALYDCILRLCPKATMKISWGMPTFQYHGNLVHFAQQKHHLGFYPGENGVALFKDKIEELSLKYSKGAIQLPMDKPIPFPLLEEIITYRIKENEELAKQKK